ncbi:radical SAM protein [bacterium]|nr:MAG: radical SAM protein [bacterium]
MNAQPKTVKHPCFDKSSEGVCGRVHLPVAPQCNIKCGYCDRRHDCVNESRPGVSTAVLTPAQAGIYLSGILAKEPRISVVGIAGPGDPLANPEETFGTLREAKKLNPNIIGCLSTNGLMLPKYAGEIAESGVTHVTVTVNAVDPEIGAKIYAWVRDGKVIRRGREAAEYLLERQLEGIRAVKEKGLKVKVNMILIPGVNDHHVEAVAEKMASLGVDVLNVMPMAPVAGTPFENVLEPTPEMMEAARAKAEKFLPQMRHCRRCRADAAGLLGEDRSREFGPYLKECAEIIPIDLRNRPNVAVATREGLLINQHLGEADSFQIWSKAPEGFKLVETRKAPPSGGNVERWKELASILSDCRAVLVSGFGKVPEAVLEAEGLTLLEMSGFIDMGLSAVYEGKGLGALKKRSASGCRKSSGCGGDGGGCG